MQIPGKHFINKNTLSMCCLIERNLKRLAKGDANFQHQQIKDGESFYPKRSPTDGLVDWDDDIFNIERLVRAVSPPFYGAPSFFNNQEIRLFRASVFYTDVEQHPFLESAFGEVVDVFPNNKFLVRCSGGVLIVHDYEGCPPRKGSRFTKQEPPLKKFQRNPYGFFDI